MKTGWSTGDITELKMLLRKHGYYDGPCDGRLNEDVVRAVQKLSQEITRFVTRAEMTEAGQDGMSPAIAQAIASGAHAETVVAEQPPPNPCRRTVRVSATGSRPTRQHSVRRMPSINHNTPRRMAATVLAASPIHQSLTNTNNTNK